MTRHTTCGDLLQVGFAVAVLAEILTPQQGLFGAWDSSDISLYGATATLLITVSSTSCHHVKAQAGSQVQRSCHYFLDSS